MKILNKIVYKDGGTTKYITDNDLQFCLDNRILSKTKNRWYLGYPGKQESTILESDNFLLVQFLEVLEHYEDK
jgi:hypothetical protein